MGQIKDDFEHWLRNEKENVPFYNGVVTIGISDLAEMVEEFLIWKTEEIRNTENLRTTRTMTMDDRTTKEQFEQFEQEIRNIFRNTIREL